MKSPRVVLFGMVSFNRASIPEILNDFENLPKVDESAMGDNPEAVRSYRNNLEAFRLFVQEKDVSLKEIERLTTVHRKQLFRLLDRVVSKAPDGRIQGLRGLIPYKHVKEYERTAVVPSSSALIGPAAAGAFAQLLKRIDGLESWLRKKVRERNRPLRDGEMREVNKSIRSLHREFIERCKREGVLPNEYPRNQDMLGYRSFQAAVARIGQEQASSHRLADGKDNTSKDWSQADKWPIGDVPFKLVQFDGHKIDIRLTLVVSDPFGMETLIEMRRIWILVVLDVATHAILGYHLAVGVEYNKDDVAEALQAAIVPHRKVRLTIPGLVVREGGGFPNEVLPQLEYHRWNWFQFDSAKSHLAQDTLDRLTNVVGCWAVSGRLGEPDDRALVERFFGLLEQCGFHQVPGSLGSSPTDPVRKLADVGTNLPMLMTLDQLEQVVEVALANMNGESSIGLGGRAPLEAMRHMIAKPEFLVQTLPASRRHQLFLLKEAVIKTVRGAGLPHVNFEGVRYTCDILASRPELVGRQLRIYFMARDIRTVHAFFEDGSELGILSASRQWRTTPHSLRLRKEILRLHRLKLLKYDEAENPMEAYVLFKKAEAKNKKAAGNALAGVRAGVLAAARTSAHGDGLFGPAREPELAKSDAQPTAPRRAKSVAPGKGIEPTPLNLKRTILF
jgi:transposase InsO family protein